MSKANEADDFILDESRSSGRESGECTPSPVREDGVDASDDVIIVDEIVRTVKKSCERTGENQSGTSIFESMVLVHKEAAANSSSVSVQIENEEDSLFILDNTGALGDREADSMFVLDTVGEAEESFRSSDISFGNVDGAVVSNRKNGKHKEMALDMSGILTFAGTPESPSKSKLESMRKMMCFNCGGDHMLDKCDIPHDPRRIAKNKSAHYNNKRQSTARYTSDTEITAYRPGEISKELRNALGIGFNDIPEWIYRMRGLGFIEGYPPAYLKQAVEGDSDSLLEFHMEDASFEKASVGRKLGPRINRDKVYQYPGFNVFHPKLKDREKHKFRVPTFSEFLKYHESLLLDRGKERTGSRGCSQNKRRSQRYDEDLSKKARNDEDDSDLIEVESDVEEPRLKPSCSTSQLTSPRIVEMKNEEPNDICETPVRSSVLRTQSSPALLGTSYSKCSGTPQGSFSTTSHVKPDLEKFREGIVPFETREDENLPRGFLKRLMEIVKKNSPGK